MIGIPCPMCGRATMVLVRVEFGGGKVVYVYVCPKCGYRLEIAYNMRDSRNMLNLVGEERLARQTAPIMW